MDFVWDIALALERNPWGWGTILAVLYIGGIILYRFLRGFLPNPGGAATVIFGLIAAATGFYITGLVMGPEESTSDEVQEYSSFIEVDPEAYARLNRLELDPKDAARVASNYESSLAERPLEISLSTYGPDQRTIAELLLGKTEAAAALVNRVKKSEIGLARIRLYLQENPTKASSLLPDLVEIEVMPETWRAFEIKWAYSGVTVEIAAEPVGMLTIKADPRDSSGALLSLCAVSNRNYSNCTRRIDLPLIPPGEKLSIPFKTTQ